MPKRPLERVARALCRLDAMPEDVTFEGRPMWESYLANARAAIGAMRDPDISMVSAAVCKAKEIGKDDFDGIYRAMIAAALDESERGDK